MTVLIGVAVLLAAAAALGGWVGVTIAHILWGDG